MKTAKKLCCVLVPLAAAAAASVLFRYFADFSATVAGFQHVFVAYQASVVLLQNFPATWISKDASGVCLKLYRGSSECPMISR